MLRPYAISALVGIVVGVFYGLLKVRSPAPPAVALVGLLGILVGEQLVPMAKSMFWPSAAQEAGDRTPADGRGN